LRRMRSPAKDGSPSLRTPRVPVWPCGNRIPTPRTCSRNRQVLEGIHRDGSKACPPSRHAVDLIPCGADLGATDAQGEVRYQDAIGGRRGASMAGIGRHGLVVTAHQKVRHELTMQPAQEGRSARWLSIVLRLPWHTEAPPTSIQIKDAGDAMESIDGTLRRPVVGPSARAETFMQLECTDIEFTREADVSVPIDHGRRGVAYVLRGSGMIEKKPIEMGHGALFGNVARLALYGSPGFRVFLATVPRVENRGES